MEDPSSQIAGAIRSVHTHVRWKIGSAERHLLKRKLRGHLSAEATISDYERVIQTALERAEAQVYVYWHGGTPYVAVAAVLQGQLWLVMFDLDGLMESAFIVERPDRYLNKPAFELIGYLREVLEW